MPLFDDPVILARGFGLVDGAEGADEGAVGSVFVGAGSIADIIVVGCYALRLWVWMCDVMEGADDVLGERKEGRKWEGREFWEGEGGEGECEDFHID